MLSLAVDLSAYLPIGILIAMAIVFVVGSLIGTHVLGPRERGEMKEIVYESGMNPVGTARKRFNVRFYILAMTFLVFDVEIIFLYPWAVAFDYIPMFAVIEGVLFILILVAGLFYAWRKGILEWA